MGNATKRIIAGTFLIVIIVFLPLYGMKQEEAPSPSLKVSSINCEYGVNPLGIDAARPRLLNLAKYSDSF
jgi:hypothetical protein